MPSASATVSSSCPKGAFAARARSMSFAQKPAFLTLTWRTSFLRSRDPDKAATAPFAPLVLKEIREVTGGRALWIMLLLICPLVGYSLLQAVSLYSESSLSAQQSPALAVSLSPLDGMLVPTFGSLYVAVTLLFPFVAIRGPQPRKGIGLAETFASAALWCGQVDAGQDSGGDVRLASR